MLNCFMKTNINNYAVAVLLSVNISAYKGDIPRNHILVCILLIVWILYLFFLQDILKKYRFDLPAGIEHDYSNWEKITTSVSYSLTQTRARVKKLVRMIIKIIKNKNAHSFSQIRDSITQNTNIFALAQVIVHGTPCRPTVQLCSRVALMVSVTFFLPNDNLNYVSVRFIKSAMGAKSIGTLLTNASCWCADWQDLMLLRQQGAYYLVLLHNTLIS